MDLPTHAAFGLAIGLIFFGHSEAAVLVMIGAILPDLDRDWLVRADAVGEQQRHRAILHNVFIVAISFIVSPFLATGVFLHMLQDSFTTANDKGCEWFYPLSRLVRRGKFNAKKKEMVLDPKEQIYFLQEDPQDAKTGPAIPWRRVYGPAQNSMILDRMFLLGSLVVAFVWLGFEAYANWSGFVGDWTMTAPHWILFFALTVLLISGGLLRDKPATALTSAAKVASGIFGIALMVLWGFYADSEIIANIGAVVSNLLPIVVGGVPIALLSVAIIMRYARKYKPAAVV